MSVLIDARDSYTRVVPGIVRRPEFRIEILRYRLLLIHVQSRITLENERGWDLMASPQMKEQMMHVVMRACWMI